MVPTAGHSSVDALRQHQDWFGDNDVAVSNLLIWEKHLRKSYATRSTDANKAAFYRSRRLMKKHMREMRAA
nr:unnamed protein product [Spirometra erinaceieuropaei]